MNPPTHVQFITRDSLDELRANTATCLSEWVDTDDEAALLQAYAYGFFWLGMAVSHPEVIDCEGREFLAFQQLTKWIGAELAKCLLELGFHRLDEKKWMKADAENTE